MRSRLLNLFVLAFLLLSLAPGGALAMQVDPQAGARPPAGSERPGPRPGIEQIDGSTVNSVTPAVLVPGTAVDLCLNVTVSSPDKEYMDRFDFNLPDNWTINSVADLAGTGCGRGHTFGVEAGNVVYWQTNGYPPQTGCGDWANGTYDFCANVTVPDCSGAPWSLPWNVTGDGYGSPPHGASGVATAACTVQITPPSLAQVLCPDETAAQDVTICNYGVAPLTWSLIEVPGLAALGQPSPRSGAGLIEAGSLWNTGVLVRTFADQSGSTPIAAENNGAYLFTVSGGSASGNRFARYLPDGTFDASFAPGIDFRSIDTANNQDLYAKSYLSGFYSITAGGVATHLFDLPVPDAQSSAVFSADDTELYVRSAGTVRRHSAATGAYLGEFTLNGMSGGELAYPANVQIDTNRSGRLLTYADGVVSEWDLAGNRIGTSTIPIATPSDFDTTFSFAVDGDGLVYLLNVATYNWQVYNIGLVVPDIPWLSEDLTGGTVPPGECLTITVTFDSAGLAPGDYAGALQITTDDPNTPYVTIPVSLTVLAPADITGVTYTPTNLQVAFDATAAGAPPLSYLWDFGDGATSDLEDPVHTYAAGGCYTVTLAVSNGCGEDAWSGQVCVCDPVSGVDFSWSPLAPLYGETAYFTATVVSGTLPFTYDWDWGDGTAHGSGQYASHAYALPGQYTVILMVINACGQAMMQHTITVTGPDIQVTPTGLSQTLCPDQTAAQQLQICNLGDGPLTWSLSEIPATVALGAAPIPPLRDAPARSDEGAAFPRMALEKHILANQVLLVQDDLPWYRWSTPNILSANGIGYDQVGSAQMATVDLTPYVLVIVASAQSDAFYTAWNASFARFEAYVAGGGALWIGTATSTSGLTNPLLPGGVVLNDDIYAQYGNVAAPGHPWVAGVSSPFEGLWVSHGEFSNLYPGSIVVATSATTGNPTLVDYAYGAGRVLVTSLTLEIGWDYGWSEAPILQNSLLDMYVPQADIPWLSEDLTGGTVPPGECATVTVTFDSTGLAPGDYHGDLQIESNDPDEPAITIPVTLTVLAPLGGVDFTWSPPTPLAGQTAYFSATVASGEPPFTFDWDWGDGTAHGSGQYATHVYAAVGAYTVTLTVGNACGIAVVQYPLTVVAPDIQVTPPSLSQELCPDAAATQPVTICNLGTSSLAWSLAENPSAAWLSEVPTGSLLLPAECVVVSVTFDSTGLAPGSYSVDLVIGSDDPDEPAITVPVALTVPQLAGITTVTWTAAFLQVAFDATAVGEPPLTYAWSFGDGGVSNLEDPTHTYATWGCYQVSLVVSNGCGEDSWGDTVCVCEPVGGAGFIWAPPIPLAGQTATFTATVAAGMPPFTYDWDWGDGTAHGSGPVAAHAYAAAGAYNVILTVANGCGQVAVQHTVVVVAPNIVVTPSGLSQVLCPDATATQPLTICNTGTSPLTWSLSELSGTLKYAGEDVVVRVPAIEAGPRATSRSGSRAFPARDLTVHVGWVSLVPVDVLIVTPDVAGGGDISLLLNTLAAFPDLVVTVWDGSVGTPAVADMQGYDVVFVGNDILWTSSAIDKVVLSDRLADYIDAGGKVLAASFIWSYDDWGMAGGRFLTQDYSPFEIATLDIWGTTSLGAFDAGHPIMAGITNVIENYNHQDPALSSNGVWVASWIDGENFVGVAPDSVGLNALYFHNANFGGQAGEVLHNALLYLAAAAEEIPWLSEDPIGGTVPPGECAVVDVTFDSTGLAGGIYNGSLLIAGDDPDTPEVTIPVTMTVLEPAAIVDVTYAVTGVEVAFDSTVIGATPLTYNWSFGDGGTSSLPDPTHVYAATGCYTATLTVANGCGSDTWSEQICVCEAVAGVDFAWVPAIPSVGEMIDFTGSIAAGSPPLVWHWDFDDGTTAGGQSVLHAFATPGDHLVTLTVTNGCGQAVIEHTVTVRSSFFYYYVPIVFTGHDTPWPPPDRR